MYFPSIFWLVSENEVKGGRRRASQVGREGVRREGQRRKKESEVKEKDSCAVLAHLGERHLGYLLRLWA